MLKRNLKHQQKQLLKQKQQLENDVEKMNKKCTEMTKESFN